MAVWVGAAVFIAHAAAATVAVRLLTVDSQEEAARLLDQLRHGADFAVLARLKSTDATGIDGGYLGKVDPETLRAELRDALRQLKPGETSPVVKLPPGYALLRILPDTEAARLDESVQLRKAALVAQGNVRHVPDLDGQQEALSVMPEMTKPEGWEQDLRFNCEIHHQAYAIGMERVNRLLDPNDEHSLAKTNARPYDWIEAHFEKGQLHAYLGEMAQAVAQWQAAYDIAKAKMPKMLPIFEEALGIGYLHQSEMDNDVYRDPGERCLFPMRPEMRYAKPENSEKAVHQFLNYLEHSPNDLEVKWLLNVAEMTLGKYPDGVPAKYLLAPSLFESPERVGRFKDVAKEAGLDLFALSSGVLVEDFDNDGLLDVATSSYDACAPMHFYHNNGDGTFSDRTKEAGLADQLGGLNLIETDYNNDGCTDILVIRGAWEKLPQRKSLLRNNCNGTFTDVTKEAHLTLPGNSQAAVWADINNDGLLDLFVVNERSPSQLFLNKGDGTFEDISHAAGIDTPGAFSKGVTAADYDGDGYVDFYVSNINANGKNYLYHNNHDGTFTDVAEQAGVTSTGRDFATWFFDYDNDGLPDIFVGSFFTSVDENIKTYLGLPFDAGTLKLYKNLGNGTFKDVTKDVGLDKVFLPMGANFGDIDNDGYLDIYLGTGSPSYASVVPNVMLRNKEGKSFVDVTASSGTGDLHKGHGVAFADLDNDGDEDILTSIGGATPGDSHRFRLFENPGNDNDWIVLKLVGVKSNRPAMGARIKVTVKNEGGLTRAIYRTVGSQSSFGGSPLRQHIGLGKAAEILKIEVWWPGSTWATAPQQTFTNVEKRQFIEIKEGAAEYSKLEYRPYRLGGAHRRTP